MPKTWQLGHIPHLALALLRACGNIWRLRDSIPTPR
jgi:hypothetical protein